MCDSLLSHMVIGLLALLPPAPVCAGDECRCHSGHPSVSTGHMLFVTAPNRPAAQPLCSPEHTLPCLLHDEWLISAFIYFYLEVKILKILHNLNLATTFTVISLMSSAARPVLLFLDLIFWESQMWLLHVHICNMYVHYVRTTNLQLKLYFEEKERSHMKQNLVSRVGGEKPTLLRTQKPRKHFNFKKQKV